MKNFGKYYITEWEANGRDDSDGDVIVYNANTKSLEHNFWTTRGYCPCTYNAFETDTLEDGFNAGLITEDEVKEAIIREEVKGGFGIPSGLLYELTNMELNIPVKSVKGARGFKGEGILRRVEVKYKRDIYGRENNSYYAIIYKEEDNSLYKTGLHNIVVLNVETISNELRKRYIEKCTLDDLKYYIRAKNAQFSGPYVLYWAVARVGIWPFINDRNFDVTNDYTKKLTGNALKASVKAAEYVKTKYDSIKEWANKLEGKSEEDKKDIVIRTLNKYYREKIEKAGDNLDSEIRELLK